MLTQELKSLIEGDVEDSPEILRQYSTDASIFYVKPSVVVFPKSTQDIKKLVKFVATEKKKGREISLTARAAGTDMSGGPLSESIVVVFTKYMNRLIEAGEDYAVAEPGMYYRDFEKETLKKDLFLPSYPGSKEICAIGGIVANNAGGEKTLRYGKTERYVDTVWMVLADGKEYAFSKISQNELEQKKSLKNFEGKVYRKIYELINQNYEVIKTAKPNVTKNSSGYFLWNVYDKESKKFDLAQLIVGSQGTLGIITKIKLKLIQPKKHSKLLLIFLKDFSILSNLIKIVLPLKPESFESYDDKTFRLAIKFFPEILHQIKSSILKIMLRTLPEFWIVLTYGVPKLVLLAQFSADTQEEAEQKVQEAKKIIEKKLPKKLKMRIAKTQEEMDEFWIIRRESFNLLRKHVRGMKTAPFIDDFSVKAEYLPEFLPKLYEILNQYNLLYTIAGHVGDGNFHIIPLMRLSDPKTKDIIKELSKKVYDLVLSFKGTITSEHNDGIIRTPFLRQEFGDVVYDLFKKTKNIFDPLNIFNPGKKVDGTFSYLENHINIEKP